MFDKNRSGLINHQEFLETIKGSVNSKRGEVINKAWDALVSRFGEEIKFESLIQAFDDKNHPDVIFSYLKIIFNPPKRLKED